MLERFEKAGLFIVEWIVHSRGTKDASERELGALLGPFSVCPGFNSFCSSFICRQSGGGTTDREAYTT